MTLSAAPKSDPAKSKAVKLQNATATFSQKDWDVKGLVDGNVATGWAISPKFNEAHTAVFETAAPIDIDGPLTITLQLNQQFADGKHLLGRFRVSFTTSPLPLAPPTIPEAIAPILKVAAAERTAEQTQQLKEYYYAQDRKYVELKEQLVQITIALANPRLAGAQDLAWALLNNPAFLFNR
jgi:hypothetical protein